MSENPACETALTASAATPSPPTPAGRVLDGEECRAVIAYAPDAIFVVDAAGQLADVNPAACELVGSSREQVIGARVERYFEPVPPPGPRGEPSGGWNRYFADGFHTIECIVHRADGSRSDAEVRVRANFLPGLHLCVARDCTERKLAVEAVVQNRTAELDAATAQLRSRAHQQESVAELGQHALAGASIEDLMHQAVRTVATVLELECCVILEHADPESSDLVLRASVGWMEDAIGQAVATADPAFSIGYALQAQVPVVFEDLDVETRFGLLPGMREAGIVSGLSVSISDEHGQFGLLAARCKRRRSFTPDDTHFLRSVANVLATAIGRHRTEETFRQAQLGAVQANNAKIEFLSRMSHELRTPLNAILGFSQLLGIERLTGGQRESVEQITRAGGHLLELVNEVLDISRIDSGNLALVPEPLAVDELRSEAVDLIRPLADARGIVIFNDPPAGDGDAFHVLADRQRLRQVLLNLLSNAVKYNRPAGTVTLRTGTAPDARHVRLSITDTGAGISAEYLPRLFTPFERLGAENTDVEGSGMGLALSKRLVEAQGGAMGVESTAGVGSTFWIDLPVAAAPLYESSVPSLLDELIHTQLFEEDEETSATPLAAPALPALAPRQRVILHIEDNEPNQRLIEMLLSQRSSLRLLTASRGGEGFALAQKHRPDLILLDMHLPDTSGENVLHDLRADEGTRDLPVVIVSADAASIRHSQLHANGANNYLLKPFNVTQFLKILDEYLLKSAA